MTGHSVLLIDMKTACFNPIFTQNVDWMAYS